MPARTEVTFSDEDMQTIFKALRDPLEPKSEERFSKAMLTIWGILLGDPDWYKNKEGPTIDPTLYAIPTRQWENIGRWISEYSTIDDRVSNTMQWVNIGPSAFEEPS